MQVSRVVEQNKRKAGQVTAALDVSKNVPPKQRKTGPQYLGRKFLKEFCDPDNEGAYRFYEGIVDSWDYLPKGVPKRQYLLKYTDGDQEHVTCSEVRNLFFVDEIGDESESASTVDAASVEKDFIAEIDQCSQDSVSSTPCAMSSDRRPAKLGVANSIQLRRGMMTLPKAELSPNVAGSSMVVRYFESLLSDKVNNPFRERVISTDNDFCAGSLPMVEGKRKRKIQSLSGVVPLSHGRIQALLSGVKYKFSWQLGESQVQCDTCKKWWKNDSSKRRKESQRMFMCAEQGGTCSIECLVCCDQLGQIAGLDEATKEGVLMRAARLCEHSKSCPSCIPDPRTLASLITELEDSLPWRAVTDSRSEVWRRFRATCATAVTYARVGESLIWLVKNLNSRAVNSRVICDLEFLCERLSQQEAGLHVLGTQRLPERERRCAAASLASAILMFVDQHVLDWVGVETLNRRWETSASGWVESEELEQTCGFRYIVRCELSDRCLSGSQLVAAKMRRAHEHCDSPVYCDECGGSGRNREAQDEDCSKCLGTGVVSGDSPFKRQLQDGTPFKLRVGHVNEHKGLGVFAEEDIPAGVAVCEYVGEVISLQEAGLRERAYAENGLFYMFEPRKLTTTMRRWVTDATRLGNVARFVNHACDPGGNLVVRHFAASGRLGWNEQVHPVPVLLFEDLRKYPLQQTTASFPSSRSVL